MLLSPRLVSNGAAAHLFFSSWMETLKEGQLFVVSTILAWQLVCNSCKHDRILITLRSGWSQEKKWLG
ncbi:unnamed protein product [Leptidea sinapis]|uniref:Uncharacterized protein n=1 Tax=Leptidea sinapis TaxID=189913 RepID=A0A5E4QVY4_9NEOP|nr:unnamed protein product [Leptidea sinapis]